MSWTTTWPESGVPQYADHATEAEAAHHAEEVVRAGALHATYFETDEMGTA